MRAWERTDGRIEKGRAGGGTELLQQLFQVFDMVQAIPFKSLKLIGSWCFSSSVYSLQPSSLQRDLQISLQV